MVALESPAEENRLEQKRLEVSKMEDSMKYLAKDFWLRLKGERDQQLIFTQRTEFEQHVRTLRLINLIVL